MRLSEFKIRNFRSIVNSGWNTLSSDNITALIGQNESGKTSVLEALYNFYTGIVSEDVLRSDMTMPEVSCSYITEEDQPLDFNDDARIPSGVSEAIKSSNKIVLTRKWYPDLSSCIFLSGHDVEKIFDRIEEKESGLIHSTLKEAKNLIKAYHNDQNEIKRLEENILSLNKEIDNINSNITALKKQLRRVSDQARKEVLKRNSENAAKQLTSLSEKIKAEKDNLYEIKLVLADRDFLKEYAENTIQISENLERAVDELENAHKYLKSVEENMPLLKGIKERKAGEAELFKAKEQYIRISRETERLKESAGLKLRVLNKLLDNKQLPDAELEAKDEYEKQSLLFSREEAGEFFFKYIPPYEFFEDFSSLLPNRIDLDDIFKDNNRVEGYKAVRNFLIIAGLDPEFFKQTNNRILKQKIENLNNEVTVDFQEYWQQNLGKTNKIRIHFDLEHYDISHPEKKGKPYLEFWIKDQHERLYPKQRSRGVRWFLSFYLELKAFARENQNSRRVLLIDEPGLSLHARAQEDVLKVFEDIKGKIQFIYTTHSPHLIDTSKLYRLLAVQRAHENHEQSETIIFDASHLHSATSDTLSPVCSLMGTGLSRKELLNESKNVIVEDISTFYFLSAMSKLVKNPSNLSFLPANGPAGVTTLVNLLIGWGFDFTVLLFDNENNRNIVDELQTQLKDFTRNNSESRLQYADNIPGAEDLLSTLDFKKYVIKKRIGISGNNSDYIKNNDISRPLISASFAQAVSSGTLTINDFDEETQNNLKQIFDSLLKKIRIWGET